MGNKIFLIEITGVLLLGSKKHLQYVASSNLHIQKSMFLVIESDFVVHVFCRDVEINTREDYKIPKHVIDENAIEILMENWPSWLGLWNTLTASLQKGKTPPQRVS